MPKGIYIRVKLVSLETRKKISKALKGHPMWNKTSPTLGKHWKIKDTSNMGKHLIGKKLTQRIKEKISKSNLLTFSVRNNSDRQGKNNNGGKFMKGRQHSEETKRKMSKAAKNYIHWNWNPDREVIKNRPTRTSTEYVDFRNQCKNRDKNCKLKDENCNGYLIVHHIKRWIEYPELRFDIDNGITLCQKHHPRKIIEEKRLIPTLQKLITKKVVQ
mgnify:CR=1 FL=1